MSFRRRIKNSRPPEDKMNIGIVTLLLLVTVYSSRADEEAGEKDEKTQTVALLVKRWKMMHTFFQNDEIGIKMKEMKEKISELMGSIRQRIREQMKLKLKELLKEE